MSIVIFVSSKYGYVLIFLMHFTITMGNPKVEKRKRKLKNMGNQSRVLREDGNRIG